MSTHATLAYKKDGKHFYKDVHYGLFSDVESHLKNCTANDVIKSVDAGDSTSLFAGFYLNEEYCKKHLNWSHDMVKDINQFKPRCTTLQAEVLSSNKFVYVLIGNEITIYKNGLIEDRFKLAKGDGKGAIRNALEVALLRKGIGYWLDKNVFQWLPYACKEKESPTLFIMLENGKLIKASDTSMIDVKELIGDVTP